MVRPSPTPEFDIVPLEVDEDDVGGELLTEGDEVYELERDRAGRFPPQFALFEEAHLLFVEGSEVNLDELIRMVSDAYEGFFDLEFPTDRRSEVPVGGALGLTGVWVPVEEPARLRERIELLREFDGAVPIVGRVSGAWS